MRLLQERIILIGGGGHCKVVIDAIKSAKNYAIEGILDPGYKKGEIISGIPAIGNDDLLASLFAKGVKKAFISVGSIGDCAIRKRLYEKAKGMGFSFPVIRHPRSVVAENVCIGEGTFVAASATINTDTVLGNNVIINTSSSVDHDCSIGDFVHVAPGAVLSGGIKVGKETHIGTGAIITQNVKIADRCFIKAGSLVKEDIAVSSI